MDTLPLMGDSRSCIDLIVTDQPNLIIESGVHPSLHENCHHQIIYGKLSVSNIARPPHTRRTRGGASLKKVGWTRERSERKMGVWGLAPRKIFRSTPSRTSENALLKDRIKFVFIVDLM